MTSTTLASPSTFIGAPVSERDRIVLLDSLRGIALCGILLMNIPGFALPYVQRMDPSVFRSLGIFGLIMLMYKSGWFNWLFELMRPVGQMAFTNYLMQSFLCGMIFYGIGFALFGKLQRYEIYYVVLGVWIFQIIFSRLWLRYFQFGPLEWIWRSLTYWKKQPIRRSGSNILKKVIG
jgi:uncharacterized membrane protein YeiB